MNKTSSSPDKPKYPPPRTDAWKKDRDGQPASVAEYDYLELLDFARQLERELAEANARTDACEKGWAEDTAVPCVSGVVSAEALASARTIVHCADMGVKMTPIMLDGLECARELLRLAGKGKS